MQRLKARLQGHAPKSVNNVLSLLSTILKCAVKWKVIAAVPCTITSLKVHYGERAFYDFDEFDRLVEAAAKIGPHVAVTVLLAGEAGLRRGELLALRWANVLFNRGEHGTIRVAEAVYEGELGPPKWGKHRELPMTARLSRVLHGFRHLAGPNVLHVEGKPVDAGALRTWMTAAERMEGLSAKGRTHILRHSFCSHLAMLGAPAKAIQELAGHQSLTTTMRYMHLSPAARSSAVALLGSRPAAKTMDGAAGEPAGGVHGEMLEKVETEGSA